MRYMPPKCRSLSTLTPLTLTVAHGWRLFRLMKQFRFETGLAGKKYAADLVPANALLAIKAG
jgi:hypothetical protein